MVRNIKVSNTGGEIVTLKEAAKILDMSVPALYRHVLKGNILRVNPGKTVYRNMPTNLYLADVEAYARDNITNVQNLEEAKEN